MLDEPEAFLHPPQAKLLGSLLAKEHSNNQLILATHSGDIIRGILENPSNLTILRIIRKDNKNYISKLEPGDIKNLWSDPVLRFSNILDALFHEAAIICESDTDCRFYSAIMSTLYEENSNNDQEDIKKIPDIFFISSGGKDRIPIIVNALAKIKLPLRVVVDFDLLADKDKTRKIFELLGGTWNDIEKDYNTVKSAIDNNSPQLSVIQVIEKIKETLEDINSNNEINKSHRNRIRQIIKESSAWSYAKISGINIVPAGQARKAIDSLINKFKEKNIWLVPCGELESFDKNVGGHGTKWVAHVLNKKINEAPELKEARNFVSELITF